MTTNNSTELKKLFNAERDRILRTVLTFERDCNEKGEAGYIPPLDYTDEEVLAAAFSLIKILDGYSISAAKRIVKDVERFLDSTHIVKSSQVNQVLERLSSSLSH